MTQLNPNADPFDYMQQERRQMDTPLDDREGAPSAHPVMLNFDGFASGNPFMLERPSAYVRRMRECMPALLLLPENDTRGIDERILWSPIVELPFPLAADGDMGRSESAIRYPLMHMPSNHPYADSMELDEYALTLHILYLGMGVMAYDSDSIHDLYTSGLDSDSTVGDDLWGMASDAARTYAPAIRALNLGRLTEFMLDDPDSELAPWSQLMRMWDVDVAGDDGRTVSQGKVQNLLDRGAGAADDVAGLYAGLFDENDIEAGTYLPFQPFTENES